MKLQDLWKDIIEFENKYKIKNISIRRVFNRLSGGQNEWKTYVEKLGYRSEIIDKYTKNLTENKLNDLNIPGNVFNPSDDLKAKIVQIEPRFSLNDPNKILQLLMVFNAFRESKNEEQEEEEEVPNDMVCPLSLEIFKEPVMASDGHTYEEKFLLDLIARPKREWQPRISNYVDVVRSPLTKAPLQKMMGDIWYVKNWTMKKIVDAYKEAKEKANNSLSGITLLNPEQENTDTLRNIDEKRDFMRKYIKKILRIPDEDRLSEFEPEPLSKFAKNFCYHSIEQYLYETLCLENEDNYNNLMKKNEKDLKRVFEQLRDIQVRNYFPPIPFLNKSTGEYMGNKAHRGKTGNNIPPGLVAYESDAMDLIGYTTLSGADPKTVTKTVNGTPVPTNSIAGEDEIIKMLTTTTSEKLTNNMRRKLLYIMFNTLFYEAERIDDVIDRETFQSNYTYKNSLYIYDKKYEPMKTRTETQYFEDSFQAFLEKERLKTRIYSKKWFEKINTTKSTTTRENIGMPSASGRKKKKRRRK